MVTRTGFTVPSENAEEAVRKLTEFRGITRVRLVGKDEKNVGIGIEMLGSTIAGAELRSQAENIMRPLGGRLGLKPEWLRLVSSDKFWREFTTATSGHADIFARSANGGISANDRADNAPQIKQSSSWTGIPTLKERAQHVRAVVPVAIKAIDGMMAHYEDLEGRLGHNSRSHDDVPAAVLAALRDLHQALGDLLGAAEREHRLLKGDDLLSKVANTTQEVVSAMRGDAHRYAIAGMIEVVFTSLGWGGGGVLSGLVLTAGKNKLGT